MTLEKELISKSFYQTLIEENYNSHPLKVLGEMLTDERQKETADLSVIRFAQGEVYFLNKDFETAIFKWENVSNELKPWALKNLGDAHFELDLFAIAEDYYKEVKTDSDVLKTEVLLQLFSLYIRLEKLDLAVDSIKKAVKLNPDYPDVTTIAKAFFEEHQDADNAVELAVNEAIRTESLAWFEVLEGYAEKGYTAKIDPNYFCEALVTLYNINLAAFENLSAALWQSYKSSDWHFQWLKEINALLLNLNLEPTYAWKKISTHYKETYFGLINGKYLIRDISDLIPNHLTNWLNLSTVSDKLISSTAVLSWNELFPADLDESVVGQAEAILQKAPRGQINMQEALGFFESVIKWAKAEGLMLDERIEWMVGELLDINHYHLLISGSKAVGKPTFVNMLLDENLLEDWKSPESPLENSAEMFAAASEETENPASRRSFRQFARKEHALIPCRMPVAFSNETIALIDTPILIDQRSSSDKVNQYLHLADGLVFVLNVDLHLSGKELEMAIRMREQAQQLPIHFILWKTDRIENSQISMELVEKTVSRIEEYFPDAKVTAFTEYDGESQLNELAAFMRSAMESSNLEEERTSKILHYTKMSIKYLIEKRVEMENAIVEKIEWNEEIAARLKGAQNQMSDMQEQKTHAIKTSFSKVLDDLDRNLMTQIPELLRNCSELVNENSDFGKIHVELNDEMNRRITSFIEKTAFPEFKVAIEGWITDSEREFRESQSYLDEMCESFNQLYGAEKLVLNCDFKVLDDWRRDVNRMTRGNIQLEKVNILLRSTPSQLLLKSAGKLFGALSKNKELLHNKYKQLIETKDYSQTAEGITDFFLQQFELFERSLERDIGMFFASPFEVLDEVLVETQNEIEDKKDYLSNMKKNPEIYRDPLTLFELKLRQYELMSSMDKQTIEYY
jgi:tetratricopeptide (TPR) repeat protein